MTVFGSERLIIDFLFARRDAAPDAEAAVGGVERLSYRDLADLVDAIARGLIARGVKRGDRVGLLGPPSTDFWAVYLATTSIGAIWHGLNPRYQRTEYAYIVDNADPALIFAVSPFEDRDYVAELVAAGADRDVVIPILPEAGDAVRKRGAAWDAFIEAGRAIDADRFDRARAVVEPEDIAVIVYTSGTTGNPKGAMLSHRAIVSAAQANRAWMGDGLESAICAAPMNHVGALNNICMNVLAYGGLLIFHPRVDMEALAELSKREQPSYLVASPTGFMMMFQATASVAERLRSTRLIVFGGAATPKAMLEKIAPGGAVLSSVYGQTETCGIVTRTDIGASLEVMADTIGKPLPGAVTRIATPDGTECPRGQVGEIQISGPYNMSGYFRMPEQTAEAFTHDGFLHTGDLGVEREDGNFVFVGRLKEMFKSGGYNVYPAEVEQVLSTHPDIEIAVVVPQLHPMFQEVGHAYIRAHAAAKVSTEDLKAFLRDRIANYKIPKTFSFETELPALPNGKIDRKALKARIARTTAAA
ncbi:MAG: AMP-binding protein [Alphaproteobacteria bacterium]|nr:AMP-binding protein [Alphaproteobacteria bacterium]